MKPNSKNFLFRLVFVLAFVFAGREWAFAALTGCEGTFYLKLPDGWTKAYAVAAGQFVPFSESTKYTDWYEISTDAIGGTNDASDFYISSMLNDYGQNEGITPTTIGKGIQFTPGSGFSCALLGNKDELWIQANPDPEKNNTTYYTIIPPFLDIMTSDVVLNEANGKYPAGTKWTFVEKGVAGSRVPVYVSAFADGGVDLISAVGQKYTLALDAGMVANASKTGDATVTFPKQVGPTGIDTIWVYQDLSGMTTTPEKKNVKLKSVAEIEFYAPKLEFATPATYDSTGKVLTWTHPVTGDPDTDEDGETYFHWIGSDVDLYLLIINPIDNTICTECNITMELGECSKRVVGADNNGIPPFVDGVTTVSIRSGLEYMDTTAFIKVQSSDMPSLISASYGNLHFRERPIPYPQLVELYDTRGTSLGELDIPEPYYSSSQNYLDGRADSLVIYYSSPFSINDQGKPENLPFLICLDWDESNFEHYNFIEKGYSTTKKDTAVACSHIIDSLTIYNSFMARHKANGSKNDSVLTFVIDSAFSTSVKTTGYGKILSFTSYESRKTLVRSHFDQAITDRIAPVILSASAKEDNNCIDIAINVSEPVQADKKYSQEAFSFYLNSVNDKSKRYQTLKQETPVNISNENEVTLSICGEQKPGNGDFIRFRADSWVWSDTTSISTEYHWNSPTNYDETTRLPSPWIAIKGSKSKKKEGEFAKPSFRIVMKGAFQFSIVMLDEAPISAQSYAIMDMQGRILRSGTITSKETVIPPLGSGSYIIKLGMGFRRVNIR